MRISRRSASAHASAAVVDDDERGSGLRSQRRRRSPGAAWPGPQRRARQTARRGAAHRAPAPGRAPGGHGAARRRTASPRCALPGARRASSPAPADARRARSARGTPHQARASLTLSSTLRRARSGAWRAVATRPWRTISPCAGARSTECSRPRSASSRVLLPAPLGPSSATSSPQRSSKLTLCTISRSPRRTIRPRHSRRVAPVLTRLPCSSGSACECPRPDAGAVPPCP